MLHLAARLKAQRGVPEFRPGDSVKVSIKVVEGERERIQAFEGVCIARKNAGVNSNFTVIRFPSCFVAFRRRQGPPEEHILFYGSSTTAPPWSTQTDW